MTTTDVPVFSVAMANRALPLVRRIVADIVQEYPRWRDLVARWELLSAGSRPEWGESVDMQRVQREVDTYAERIESYKKELEQIGCQLKDFEMGLVDFIGMYEGRPVCLCWKHGEESVAFWHEVDAGYQGRQPITPGFLAATTE